jgi:glutathione S-transferase
MTDRIANSLRHEDDLHLDVRSLTFRFLFDPDRPTKSPQDLDRLASISSRTVNGESDLDVERELAFWARYLSDGISDAQAQASASRLCAELMGVEENLGRSAYVFGTNLSIVDVAWLVYVRRLIHCGYPVDRLHPNIDAWQNRLMENPAIAAELRLPENLKDAVALRQRKLSKEGRTLVDVCFPQLAV